MLKLVDRPDLGSGDFYRMGSSPVTPKSFGSSEVEQWPEKPCVEGSSPFQGGC